MSGSILGREGGGRARSSSAGPSATFNIIVGNEWFAVAGGALEIVGLTLVAAAVWRLTNADWVARGADP
ncbi:hypothetical protein [Arthrobacter sp. StoSoilB13]|uniref:hypothetical protein n=1 Tax=Arthrobacter sp. StoSoilB13 TaxID=2830993 RepID=UPI001CC760F3|nr:hypothetical protein [Arthrobacter sp. StoSoilB13]BCW49613.1 hypothetical protein StoSoilB13_19550 [Arthrobacter sp. StoSoilB13]